MIVGILRLNSKVKYGFTSRNVPIYLFTPFDRTLPSCIVGSSYRDTSSNVLALVKVEQWGSLPRGNLMRILGKCGDKDAEEAAIYHQYIPATWAKFDRTTIREPSFATHTKLQGYTFNVDPDGCRDIDDVITIGEDGYVYITIADVASWMSVNPHIFQHASTLGQTFYNNGSIVEPLLPIQHECSLLQGLVRHGIALKFRLSNPNQYSFERVSFVNNQSFTYESIMGTEQGAFLRSLAESLGVFTEDPHAWIEACMTFYNRRVAECLVLREKGLLRAQSREEGTSVFAKILYGADKQILSMKKATYVPASTREEHSMMGGIYTHATSPIRRFADIVNQMVLIDIPVCPFDLDDLNKRSIACKKYERDMCFLNAILGSTERTVRGIAVSDHRVWVPSWNRLITCKHTKQEREEGIVSYSVDMDQPMWKKRMVFRFD